MIKHPPPFFRLFSSLELHRFGDIDVLWNVLYTPLSLSRPSFITVIIEVIRRLERSRRKGGEKGLRRVDYRYRSSIDFRDPVDRFSLRKLLDRTSSGPFSLNRRSRCYIWPHLILKLDPLMRKRSVVSLSDYVVWWSWKFYGKRNKRNSFVGRIFFFLIELISIIHGIKQGFYYYSYVFFDKFQSDFSHHHSLFYILIISNYLLNFKIS